MCMNESSTDQTYPSHIMLNGQKYVPVGTPAAKREYRLGQRWLAKDRSAYTVAGPAPHTALHRVGDHEHRIMICTEAFMDIFLVTLVRNAPAIEVKPGMLIRGLRIGSECTVLQSSPLKVATLGHEDGVEMAMTDDAEVRWPWGLWWQRVYPEVTAAQQRASSP